MKEEIELNVLVNTIMSSVIYNEDEEAILFTDNNSNKYILMHEQDCCEDVYVESIEGDLNDLVNTPILVAEKMDNIGEMPPKDPLDARYIWTFYKFATVKGYVTIRFYGSSNGNYSEAVSFFQVTEI